VTAIEEDQMTITVYAISVDCADAEKLAGFWAAALGRPVRAGATAGSAAVEEGAAPVMLFHQVPEAKTVKNRWHLDLVTTATEAETRRLLGLGATVLRVFEENGRHRWTTFADPEGNEFDLVSG
jgi:predicted enzyme related to lactoylglutathione lyase